MYMNMNIYIVTMKPTTNGAVNSLSKSRVHIRVGVRGCFKSANVSQSPNNIIVPKPATTQIQRVLQVYTMERQTRLTQ